MLKSRNLKSTEDAYQAGMQAFRDGMFPDDNPHRVGGGNNAYRIAWFDGFYDERHDTKFGKMFTAAGLLTMKEERKRQTC